jgi:hypothetical protein
MALRPITKHDAREQTNAVRHQRAQGCPLPSADVLERVDGTRWATGESSQLADMDPSSDEFGRQDRRRPSSLRWCPQKYFLAPYVVHRCQLEPAAGDTHPLPGNTPSPPCSIKGPVGLTANSWPRPHTGRAMQQQSQPRCADHSSCAHPPHSAVRRAGSLQTVEPEMTPLPMGETTNSAGRTGQLD